jgi:hypothetical protein
MIVSVLPQSWVMMGYEVIPFSRSVPEFSGTDSATIIIKTPPVAEEVYILS